MKRQSVGAGILEGELKWRAAASSAASRTVRAFGMGALLLGTQIGEAAGQSREEAGDTIPTVALDTVRIGGRSDDLIGAAVSSAQGRVGRLDLASRPISREGELLESVPGVIVTQHSGEGKANQYFIRGFNLDHGTDFRTTVDGMPVNMPSHGHGQGYTDLNFLIPEFVDLIDYRLGVSHARVGDFGSAGGAEMHLARTLDRPFLAVEGGENEFGRLVGGVSGPVGSGTLLLGGEARMYDGPWALDQNVEKLNGIARYSVERGSSRFSILGLAYRNSWDATDQIPLRAVEDGTIDRFGYVDPSDGGESSRYSLSASWQRVAGESANEIELYAIRSDLDLFSNFTFFLEDEEAGDQFNQRDGRFVLGGTATHVQTARLLGLNHAFTLGVQGRMDMIDDLALSRSHGRVRGETIREDEVTQLGAGLFTELVTDWSPGFRSVLGLRGDLATFDVESDLPENSGEESATIVSPKASLIYTPSPRLELYLSGGYGFHSNDARGATITVDPVSGEAADRVDPLVRSRGAEVGARATPIRGIQSTLTLWALDLDSELLFVGDAGATEPSSRSRRRGVTFANHYSVLETLSLEADISFSRARLDEEVDDRIPGALERVITGGMTWAPQTGPSGSLRLRHFGEYPLIEDNSVRADAATLLNAQLGYRFGNGIRIEGTILNLLDSDAADIQYFYESRLPGEAAAVEDVHFHPVEPRQLRVTLSWGI
jgi:hypothetical protein